MAVLQTMNLTLSPCCPSDRADFIDLELDPEVMRFLNGGHAVDHDQVDPDATFLMPRGTEAYVWTARRTSNGTFVGWFCLWPESGRTRISPAPDGLGSGVSLGRGIGSHQLGVQKRWVRQDRGEYDGGEPRLAPRDGKDRYELRSHSFRRLARSHPGQRARRSLVRVDALGMERQLTATRQLRADSGHWCHVLLPKMSTQSVACQHMR